MTDASGLVYLRARYYLPGLGVFPSLDPVEGIPEQPSSLNRYGYVEGDVINNTDPSGTAPERDGVGSRYRYSCKCGWLDRDHINPGTDLAKWVHDALTQAAGSDHIVNINFHAKGAESVKYFYVPKGYAAPAWGVGLGMFKQLHYDFEEVQSRFNWADIFLRIGGKRASGFSEEDLPSNWLGYWLATRGFAAGNPWDNPTLNTSCDVMDENDSRKMFDEYANNGDFVFGWRNWYKRDRPLSVVLARPCEKGESWPAEVSMNAVDRSGYISIQEPIMGFRDYTLLGLLFAYSNGWWEVDHRIAGHPDLHLRGEMSGAGLNVRLYTIPYVLSKMVGC